MYFVRRILLMIPLLLVISFIGFGLIYITPGSPFDRERKPASPEVERNLMRKFHKDEPFLKRIPALPGLGIIGIGMRKEKSNGTSRWCRICGDLGSSQIYRNHTVNDIIAEGLPVSLSLGFIAFGVCVGVGCAGGVYHRGEARVVGRDYLGSLSVAILAVCIPGLVVGPVLVVAFLAIHFRWFPVALWESP